MSDVLTVADSDILGGDICRLLHPLLSAALQCRQCQTLNDGQTVPFSIAAAGDFDVQFTNAMELG